MWHDVGNVLQEMLDMYILSMGNSFSQDAQRYLHRIAAADGVEFYICNLFIGGY